MVRTKPSKQPLGLVVHGVPIEKVWPKATRHSDWARGAASAPNGHLGMFCFGQDHVFMVRTKPSKQPLGPVASGVPIEKVQAKQVMHSDWGGQTLDKAMYLWFEISPQNNPSDWSHVEFQ